LESITRGQGGTPIPTIEQERIHYQVAHNTSHLFKQLENNKTYHIKHEIKEKVINQIKEKLKNNGATISNADKGNSIIIIYQTNTTRNIRIS
jgi:hypothetical protein